MKKLSPTQFEVLQALAAGGSLLLRWGGENFGLITPDDYNKRVRYTVRWATKKALQDNNFIAQVPQSYPVEYRVTKAGRQYVHQHEAQETI